MWFMRYRGREDVERLVKDTFRVFVKPESLGLQQSYARAMSRYGILSSMPSHHHTAVICWAANWTNGVYFRSNRRAIGIIYSIIFNSRFANWEFLENRPAVWDEFRAAPGSVRGYLRERVGELMNHPRFEEWVRCTCRLEVTAGHVLHHWRTGEICVWKRWIMRPLSWAELIAKGFTRILTTIWLLKFLAFLLE